MIKLIKMYENNEKLYYADIIPEFIFENNRDFLLRQMKKEGGSINS